MFSRDFFEVVSINRTDLTTLTANRIKDFVLECCLHKVYPNKTPRKHFFFFIFFQCVRLYPLCSSQGISRSHSLAGGALEWLQSNVTYRCQASTNLQRNGAVFGKSIALPTIDGNIWKPHCHETEKGQRPPRSRFRIRSCIEYIRDIFQ